MNKTTLHTIHNNNNNNTNNNINRINLYYCNQIHKIYKIDERVIIKIIYSYIKPMEQPKQIKLITVVNTNFLN